MRRWEVAREAFALARREREAAKREERALTELGAAVFTSARIGPGAPVAEEEVRALWEQLERAEQRTAAARAALESSLDSDRRDFARASQLVRWLVVARGWLDRCILRDVLRREARGRPSIERDLGRAALESGEDALRALVPAALASEAAGAREDARRARGEREALLAPYGGRALPQGLATAVHEIGVFLGFVRAQLTSKLYLRIPALASLLVGWWIASHYTDDWVERDLGTFRRIFGGGGEKTYVDPDTRRILAFWLPLLAAALCSYLGFVVASRVQRKYGRIEGSGTTPPAGSKAGPVDRG